MCVCGLFSPPVAIRQILTEKALENRAGCTAKEPTQPESREAECKSPKRPRVRLYPKPFSLNPETVSTPNPKLFRLWLEEGEKNHSSPHHRGHHRSNLDTLNAAGQAASEVCRIFQELLPRLMEASHHTTLRVLFTNRWRSKRKALHLQASIWQNTSPRESC